MGPPEGTAVAIDGALRKFSSGLTIRRKLLSLDNNHIGGANAHARNYLSGVRAEGHDKVQGQAINRVSMAERLYPQPRGQRARTQISRHAIDIYTGVL